MLRRITPAGEKYPRYAAKTYGGPGQDGKTPLYSYYRQMLADALHDVRDGGVAYLYSERTLRDFLRYERDVNVWRRDGVFYVKRKQ